MIITFSHCKDSYFFFPKFYNLLFCINRRISQCKGTITFSLLFPLCFIISLHQLGIKAERVQTRFFILYYQYKGSVLPVQCNCTTSTKALY